ncbi:MAG: helix-turn-helix transcriptional regulator [Phycisphaerae bacterium]|nr:helix-turn-helix transcriptional regulator [Phycisphaerae bacterium]
MPLTDLEHTVLGNVWKKGECSGYEILQEFTQSTAAYYRSREGAIYPLLARLVRRRLLRARADKQGKRPRRLYSISPTGLLALKAWLAGPIPEADATVPPDLVRTRIYFLGAIEPAQRRSMLRDAAKRIRGQLAANRKKLKHFESTGNVFAALAVEGIVLIMQARLSWIQRVDRSPELAAIPRKACSPAAESMERRASSNQKQRHPHRG